jgi:predicted nucleotidyltransferase
MRVYERYAINENCCEFGTLKTNGVLRRCLQAVLKTAGRYSVGVLSIVLYGSRGRGDQSLDSDYDIFVMLSDRTTMFQYVQFSAEVRMAVRKLPKVKIFSCRMRDFRRMLKDNPFLGAFCYVITVDGNPIFDPRGRFRELKHRMERLSEDEKKKYMVRCLQMSKRMGSVRWVGFWRKKISDE